MYVRGHILLFAIYWFDAGLSSQRDDSRTRGQNEIRNEPLAICVAPIMQLRTCVINIINIQVKSPNVEIRFSNN